MRAVRYLLHAWSLYTWRVPVQYDMSKEGVTFDEYSDCEGSKA